MNCPPVAVLTKDLTLSQRITDAYGAAIDADAVPTYSIYEEDGTTAILTGSFTKITTGHYSEKINVTSANGFEENKSYVVTGSATIGGTAYTVEPCTFIVFGSAPLTSSTASDNLWNRLISAASDQIEKYCDRTFTSTTYREIYDAPGSDVLQLNNYPVTAVTLLSASKIACMILENTSSDAYNSYISISSTTMTLVVQGGSNAGSSSLTLDDYASITALNSAITALNKGWSGTVDSNYASWDPVEILPAYGKCTHDGPIDIYIPDTPIGDFEIEANAGIIRGVDWGTGTQQVVVKYTAGYSTIPYDLEQATIMLAGAYKDAASTDLSKSSERLGDYAYTIAQQVGIPSVIREMINPYRRRA